MMSLNALVFNEVIQPAGTAFTTASEVEQALGDFDQMAVQAVIDNVDVGGNFTLNIQTSADGENWVNKNATPEISNKPFNAGSVTNLVGADTGANPTLGRVRLRFSMTGAGRAHVKIYVTQRTWVR